MIGSLRMSVCVALVAASCMAQGFAVEVSESYRKEIDSAVAKFEESSSSASAKLLAAFDKQIEILTRNKKLNSDEKASIVAAIEAEKDDFKRHGTLPFSPTMRSDAKIYLKSFADSKAKAEKPFDKAITHYRNKAKDTTTATELADEKQKLLGRRLLGTWTFTHPNLPSYSVPIYSDGAAGPNRNWDFDDDGIVIRHRTQSAPQGVWVDKGVIEPSGKICEIKNQIGQVKKGALSNPE